MIVFLLTLIIQISKKDKIAVSERLAEQYNEKPFWERVSQNFRKPLGTII